MNLLRRPVRQQVTGGGWQYAIVEEFVKGHATVRLGSPTGPRMTMLPVLTAFVAPGEKVIVDHSAEGQPYVRPITALPTEAEEPVAISAPEPTEDLGLVAARLTTSGPVEYTGVWGCYYYILVPGVGYHLTKRGVPWDVVAWETQPGLCKIEQSGNSPGYAYNFVAPEDGKYLVRWCLGFEGNTGDEPQDTDSGVVIHCYHKYWDGITWEGFGNGRSMRMVGQKSWGVDLMLTYGCGYIHLDSPDNKSGWVRNAIDIYFEMELDYQPWYTQGEDPTPWIGKDFTLAYKEGCYPVMEVYKVAQTAQSLEATWWYRWWDYL